MPALHLPGRRPSPNLRLILVPQPREENPGLPAQGGGRTAVPEHDAGAVHFFGKGELRGENLVSEFR